MDDPNPDCSTRSFSWNLLTAVDYLTDCSLIATLTELAQSVFGCARPVRVRSVVAFIVLHAATNERQKGDGCF